MNPDPNLPRYQVVPLPGHQVSFQVDGVERTRWHTGSEYPRPFFYPLNGPSGETLTRLGHPGAPDHEHHRSVWFAHFKVLGIDFWGDGRNDAYIRQRQWLAFEDGEDAARMAVMIGWYDGHNPQPLISQELVAEMRDDAAGGTLLELQARFIPEAEMLEFQQTNFGFLAVRVAKSISEHFGGGKLTNSEERQGEKDIFGKRAKWMDYSGLIRAGDKKVTEGITFYDHPDNAPEASKEPVGWHVRQDGWMGASACMFSSRLTTQQSPLTLRYLLHAHGGELDPEASGNRYDQFCKTKGFVVEKGKSHTRHVIRRAS